MGRRRKSDSSGKTILLVLLAAFFLIAAIYVVVQVIGTIHKDYSLIEQKEDSSTETAQTIEIEHEEETQGWNETERGWTYKLDDETWATDQWLEIEGFLYHFNEDGIMNQGKWQKEGQIYTCHDAKGYLKNIETDLDYIPDDMGENLDSLARTNAFWCFLDDEDTGIFKTILYRRTVENKVKPLGDENAPERTTKYSLRADGDYVYYLPLVKESEKGKLTESEKALCGRLVRMIPGQAVKEIIAEDVDGYLVVDGTIYYAQGGKIHSAASVTETAVGEESYKVQIRDGSCYLTDSLGNIVTPENGTVVEMGDRSYRLEENGAIRYVKRRDVSVNGVTFRLKREGTGMMVLMESDGASRAGITGEYGVQSFCIVDNFIFYCAYVDKGANGEWYSRIFRADLNGEGKTPVSGMFPGTITNLYYFENEGQMYGEYYPEIWKNAYGTIVNVSQSGTIYRINDANVRTGIKVSGNDMLELVMAQDGKLICLWHDCSWSPKAGITKVLWSRPVEFSASEKISVETVSKLPEQTAAPAEKETTKAAVETVPVNPQQVSGSNQISPAETTAAPVKNPNQPADTPGTSVQTPKQETILGTEAPGKSIQTNPSETKSDEVKIVPLG